jgi:hypothetical protein
MSFNNKSTERFWLHKLYSVYLTSIWHAAAGLCLNSGSWKADVPKGSYTRMVNNWFILMLFYNAFQLHD